MTLREQIEALPRWECVEYEGCFPANDGDLLERVKVLAVVRDHLPRCATCRHAMVRGADTACERPELELAGWLPVNFGCVLYEPVVKP